MGIVGRAVERVHDPLVVGIHVVELLGVEHPRGALLA